MMITLGYNCFLALGLRKINSFQPSLPFDYIGNNNGYNSFISVYQILEQLYNNKLDIENFISVNDSLHNSLNFYMGHFYKQRDINRVTESHEEKTPLSLFTKRFTRLKLNFFNQPNLVFYTSNRVTGEDEHSLQNTAQSIINLNNLNHIVIIGPHESKIINDNIEFVKYKKRRSKAIKNCLNKYFSKMSPETKESYEKYIQDIPE